VAQSPGGPVHVLVSDERAEHLPGCNMAFWRYALLETGGFDPIFTAAGDDVDLCWRVLDRGWELGFHPAALVWHHRRSQLRAYVRQQREYGRSEALVQVRHPHRFTFTGTARWHGRMYNPAVGAVGRQRIYRGAYGSAAFQSVYGAGGHGLDLAHQVGVPLAVLALLSAPLGLAWAPALLPAALGLALLVALATIDMACARPPRRVAARARFALSVAGLHLVQPLVRMWARRRHLPTARRDLPPKVPPLGPARAVGRGTLMVPFAGRREDLAAALVAELQRAGVHAAPAGAWEDHDAKLVGSTLVRGELVTSAYPTGYVQVQVRRRPRWALVATYFGALVVGVFIHPTAAAGLAVLGVVEVSRGTMRLRTRVRRAVGGTAE
jgi:hypothetical protein